MLYNILIFIIILLIYLHVYYHLKVSNDLEVFEHDISNVTKLDEILSFRQPVVINFFHKSLNNLFNLKRFYNDYGKYNINVRKNNIDNNILDKYTPVNIDLIKDLFENDKTYYSEHNSKFLKTSNLIVDLQNKDSYLKPPLVSSSEYDILFGGMKTSTKFKYEINYRNFIYVSDGSINICLSPPVNSKYMDEYNDYYNFEFISSINPFLKENNDHLKNISKINLTLNQGQMLFIPAYWWYSIEFNNSVVLFFKYKTYMNEFTIFPHYALSFMQRQNVKNKQNTNKVHINKPKASKKTPDNSNLSKKEELVTEKKKEKKNKNIKKKKLNNNK